MTATTTERRSPEQIVAEIGELLGLLLDLLDQEKAPEARRKIEERARQSA